MVVRTLEIELENRLLIPPTSAVATHQHLQVFRITVLQLAKNAEISTQLAKQYLDEKAKELNADFEVNEEGNVLYHFS
ncbi:hypothetical protein [Nostoc sp. TCL240-02]|uniref:hypothetical protein n=1 Tax=Nostoc sp. TCL240-02 TaxID=2572090 RepID=UPI00157FA7C8|nr:hypothetical protein [Nostoc sp. TCL240-02]QKQ73180.1 hypothetical protein FBB35_07185 [Nostoc sp. TCL240-02]